LALEIFEGFGGIAWKRDVDIALVVVPCDGHAREESVGPVVGDFVEILQGVEDVVDISVVCLFDAEIINN
jgi:hypothetical protein